MVVLGIDPGYGRVGYGVIDYTKNKYKAIEYGSITTEANTPLPKRLHKTFEDTKNSSNTQAGNCSVQVEPDRRTFSWQRNQAYCRVQDSAGAIASQLRGIVVLAQVA